MKLKPKWILIQLLAMTLWIYQNQNREIFVAQVLTFIAEQIEDQGGEQNEDQSGEQNEGHNEHQNCEQADGQEQVQIDDAIGDNQGYVVDGNDKVMSVESDGAEVEVDEAWKHLIPTEEEMAERYPRVKDMQRALLGVFGGAKLSGTYAKLTKRFRKMLYKKLKDPSFALKCLTYREAKGKPDTMKFHSETFNYVDRLDMMISFLNFPHSFTNEHMLILIYIQSMFIVQAHSCCEDSKWDYEGFDVPRYKSDEEYRKKLYRTQKQSIKMFHKELLTAMRTQEDGLKEKYEKQQKLQKKKI